MKWLLWVVTAAACGSSQSLAGDAGEVDGPLVDAGPPALKTDWAESQTTCGFLMDGGTELYGNCTSSDPAPEMPGVQFCFNNTFWTQACAGDGDCPAGTQCAPYIAVSPPAGVCAKTCTLYGNADCGNCDLWCLNGLCTQGGPGYPTNLPCDATHPGIQAALLGFTGLGSDLENRWTFTLPGATLTEGVTNYQIVNGDELHVIFPWPAGTTTGPATTTFMAEGPGVIEYQGSATFTADPTACVAVTIQLSDGLLDAGP